MNGKRIAVLCLNVLLVFLLFSTIYGCRWMGNDRVDKILKHAENIMDNAPDSALILLSDTSLRPRTNREKALYSLLLTQARHKNYIDETNDSLISTAVDYFDGGGKSPYLMKSLFYKSIINYNATNYRLAMRAALRAKEMAISLNDTYWQARTAEQVARIFSKNHFHKEAIKEFGDAARNYRNSGLESAYLYSLGDIALAYSNICDHINTILFTDSILAQNPSSNIVAYCASILSYSYYKSKRPVEANQYADTICKYSKIVPLESSDYSTISNIKIDINQFKEAKVMLDSAFLTSVTESDSLSCYIATVRLYEKQNDTVNAYLALNKVFFLQNKMEKELIKQSSVVAQRDYFEDEMTLAREKNIRKDYIIGMIAIVLLSVIFYILIWRHFKIIAYNNEIERTMTQIQLLTNEMQQSDATLKILESKIADNQSSIKKLNSQLSSSLRQATMFSQLSHEIFGDRIEHLNMLINQFYDMGSSEATKKLVINNIKKEIEKLTSNSSIEEIERIVNSFNDDIISKMRQELPEFSQNDINFIILVSAGFNSRAISMFIGIKPNSTYMKRKRLIDRIRSIAPPHADSFIALIENHK